MKAFFLQFTFRWFGLMSGITTILLLLIFNSFPKFAEVIYGKTLFPIIRLILDFSFGIIPFAVAYFLPFVLILLVFFCVRIKGFAFKIRILFNFIGFGITAFYLLWGFNYSRLSIQERHSFKDKAISNEEVHFFTEQCIHQINTLRNKIKEQPENLSIRPKAISELKNLVYQEALLNGFKTTNHLHYKTLNPPGILRRWGITGIYMPFTGEGLLEANHNLLEKPFIIAHELAHGHGITDEGEANLIAYLACSKCSDILINYNAHLAMWQYLVYELKTRKLYDHEKYGMLLSEQVKNDLKFLAEEQAMYPQFFPGLSEEVNDAYLKTHGIDEGIDAYLSLPILYLKYQSVN